MAARAFDILIIGGGQAGRRAAEGARAVNEGASIAILGEETHAPYDRPPLSKAVLLGDAPIESCEVRTQDSYARDRIDLLLGERARELDCDVKLVLTENGDRISYQKLVLACGSRARTFSFDPRLADRVLSLRTRDDAGRLAPKLKPGARVVVIGAGFIGLEVASAARARGAAVCVLEGGDRVLARVFPAEASERVAAWHRDAGVDLRLGVSVRAIVDKHDGAVSVETNIGAFIADVVVVGIGVVPNTELAGAAGVAVDDGILVSAHGNTSCEDVFAAGEVTRHPVAGGPLRRIEAWQIAEIQAESAGRTAAGKATAHNTAPWFWSDQLGHNIQVAGLVEPGAASLVRVNENSVLMFGADERGRLTGVIGFDAGAEMSVAKRLIGMEMIDALADPTTPLKKLLRSAANAGI